MTASAEEVYDLLGIGFGPANLALAIAMRESQEVAESNVRFAFLEKQSGFAWHPSLLLPGSQLQVSPMKDLATMRDPTSSYTFTNYLHQQGRLAAFINRDASTPSRREWSAYLHWAAKRMEDVVTYGQEVIRVQPVQRQEDAPSCVHIFRVTSRDVQTGLTVSRLAKNITVAVGGVPQVPAPLYALYKTIDGKPVSSHVIHSSTYLPSLAAIEPTLRTREMRRLADPSAALAASSSLAPLRLGEHKPAPLRFAVIGSGQSAAEMSLHLRKVFPTAHVSLIFRASALVPSDDSAFVNAAAFDPERTNTFWSATEADRMQWLAEYRRTNYSVVRCDVLNELHTAVYEQEVDFAEPWPHADGPPSHGRLRIVPNTQVEHAERVTCADDAACSSIALRLTDLKRHDVGGRRETYDAVFLGTGFARGPHVLPFLAPLQHLFPRLDARAAERKGALGFGEEKETAERLTNVLALEGDEAACERLRQRERGITRDYRLVSYASDAFTEPTKRSARRGPSPRQALAARKGKNEEGLECVDGTAMLSGASTPDSTRREAGSSTGESSGSSTLADAETEATTVQPEHAKRGDMPARARTGPPIEPSIYFLGGNEATHGLSDSLLSTVAHRSGEVCTSIIQRLRQAAVQEAVSHTATATTTPAAAKWQDDTPFSPRHDVPPPQLPRTKVADAALHDPLCPLRTV